MQILQSKATIRPRTANNNVITMQPHPTMRAREAAATFYDLRTMRSLQISAYGSLENEKYAGGGEYFDGTLESAYQT